MRPRPADGGPSTIGFRDRWPHLCHLVEEDEEARRLQLRHRPPRTRGRVLPVAEEMSSSPSSPDRAPRRSAIVPRRESFPLIIPILSHIVSALRCVRGNDCVTALVCATVFRIRPLSDRADLAVTTRRRFASAWGWLCRSHGCSSDSSSRPPRINHAALLLRARCLFRLTVQPATTRNRCLWSRRESSRDDRNSLCASGRRRRRGR